MVSIRSSFSMISMWAKINFHRFFYVSFFSLLLLSQTVLLATGEGNSEWFQAVEKGNVSKVQSLLNQGIEVDQRNRIGRTALHIAIHKGHKKVVQKLIESGADIHARSRERTRTLAISRMTPLMIAANHGRTEIVKELIRKGAEVNVQDARGETAIIKAVKKGHKEVLKQLLNTGVHPFARTVENKTARMIARSKNNPEIAQILETYEKTYLDQFIGRISERVKKKEKLRELIQKLGAKDYNTREQTRKTIKEMGVKILPFLKKHRDHKNPEIQNQVRNLLRRIAIKHILKKKQFLQVQLRLISFPEFEPVPDATIQIQEKWKREKKTVKEKRTVQFDEKGIVTLRLDPVSTSLLRLRKNGYKKRVIGTALIKTIQSKLILKRKNQNRRIARTDRWYLESQNGRPSVNCFTFLNNTPA